MASRLAPSVFYATLFSLTLWAAHAQWHDRVSLADVHAIFAVPQAAAQTIDAATDAKSGLFNQPVFAPPAVMGSAPQATVYPARPASGSPPPRAAANPPANVAPAIYPAPQGAVAPSGSPSTASYPGITMQPAALPGAPLPQAAVPQAVGNPLFAPPDVAQQSATPVMSGQQASFAPTMTPAHLAPANMPPPVAEPFAHPTTDVPFGIDGTPRTLEDARILARVGSNGVILAGDILPDVNEAFIQLKARIPPDKYDEAKLMLLQQRLQQAIQTKAIIAEVQRKIPEEAFKSFQEKLGEQFDLDEVPKVLQKLNAKNVSEIEAKLREFGSSLARERRVYVEKALAITWVRQQVPEDGEVTHDAMLYYYHLHGAEFDRQAKARWEQLTARFDKHPDRASAQAAISAAGNRILNGEDWATVARQMSSGHTADKGGQHEWTTQGALRSKALDAAIFTLPVGQMSTVIEDADGCHIIRVTERQEAGRQPFTEAQQVIRDKLKEDRHAEAIQKYVDNLIANTQKWTIFDPPPVDTAKPASPDLERYRAANATNLRPQQR